jgi:hypothetical protein
MKEILETIASSLDLSPVDKQEAISKKKTIENYFNNQKYSVETYIQGSFAYGTAIKPYRNDKEGDFDLDIVTEIKESKLSPKDVKHYIGDVLKKSNINRFLEEEGKRCWTLNYDNFHIDVLPSKPNQNKKGNVIKITNKEKDTNQYTFKSSNPKDLKQWFNNINNDIYSTKTNTLKSNLFEKNKKYFEENLNIKNWIDVDDYFISSPLRDAIKIMKRHRDILYANSKAYKNKPISIIITIITAQIAKTYKNIEIDKILELFISKNKEFIKKESNIWVIENPVDNSENFADKWHEDNNARYNEYNKWVKNLEDFVAELKESNEQSSVSIVKKYLGENVSNKYFENINKRNKPKILNQRQVKPWGKNE